MSRSANPRRAARALNVAVMVCGALLAATASLHGADTVNGNLLLVAKAEVEVYHNGKKIFLRDKAKDNQQFRVKVPERTFKAGDVIVLHALSPYVYRAVVAAIALPGDAGQIAVKKSDWRFMGENKSPGKITAADIQASSELLATGNPDPSGEAEREKLGVLPVSDGGSEWVKTANQLSGWYCIGFVVTPELLQKPVK